MSKKDKEKSKPGPKTEFDSRLYDIKVTKSLKNELEKKAKYLGIHVNALVRMLLIQAMEKEKESQKE
jgi:hypothetical protein